MRSYFLCFSKDLVWAGNNIVGTLVAALLIVVTKWRIRFIPTIGGSGAEDSSFGTGPHSNLTTSSKSVISFVSFCVFLVLICLFFFLYRPTGCWIPGLLQFGHGTAGGRER